MSLFSRNDVRERERQNRLSTADLAAMDTRPEEPPVADARADEPVPVEVQDARRTPKERAAERATPVRGDDVEDAVETVKAMDPVQATEPRSDGRDRPAPVSEQRLAPLFQPGVAQDFRARWDATQIGFVDDPRQAVKQADELVAQVMQRLAKSFADERTQLEAQMDERASTENLRVALQRYRSFFQRLLSL